MKISFDRYYRYDELSEILHGYAREYPYLVKLESLGKSYEKRDIWLVKVTNFQISDLEKPALWVDGNIHASEVSSSSACLYLLNFLVEKYGQDPDVTHCLDSRAFYICPRINPDGAELALGDHPKIIRSGTRPYPFLEEPIEGLSMEDVDDDGRILTMRIPDNNGAWKAHPTEPRLMVRRDPTERGGQYYRLLPEGRITNYNGAEIPSIIKKQQLDFNRNFPQGWKQEYEQEGAGPYPTSEQEVRAVVAFVTSHPNLTGAISFHTFSGVLLRPYSYQEDVKFPAEDLWTFLKIGEKGTEMTGYPNISVFHDFQYHPNKVITGAFDDWAYEQLGLFSWTVELWSPQRQAGIEKYKFIDWYREHPIEDDFKLLQWSDTTLEGKGFINWYPVEHPDLGSIELGGWNWLYCFRNPPPAFLEKEIAPFAPWLVWHLLISPRLEIFDVQVKPLGKDLYQIGLFVENTGWLPTYITKKAVEKRLVRGILFEIEIPEGGTLISNKKRKEKIQLEGRCYKPPTATGWDMWMNGDLTKDRAKMEWIVQAPEGSTVHLTARHDRAGTVKTSVKLE